MLFQDHMASGLKGRIRETSSSANSLFGGAGGGNCHPIVFVLSEFGLAHTTFSLDFGYRV